MSTSLPSLPTSSSKNPFPLPSISEDTLFYALHLPPHFLHPSSAALLISKYIASLLPSSWIWNKDEWELKVVPDSPDRMKRGVGAKLEGVMRVGEAVDDEWVVVWLLREVSNRWPEIVISIRDTDGELLLIEAADHLPAWVSPENAENRVWLFNGHLHLLPLNIRSSGTSARRIPDDEAMEREYDPEAYLTEEDAVNAVRTDRYKAGMAIEDAVWSRVAHYPAKMREHLHRTNAYLPLRVARALSKQPALIQKAVEGFYVRDPAQVRAAAKMTHFPPNPSVLASVLMTRAAYAQLQGQVFHAPRVFGAGWSVRDSEDSSDQSDAGRKRREDERRWRDLGVKIATGFEIMYKEGGKRGRSGTQSNMNTSELRDSPEFKVYLDNLKEAGWFKGEVEGSKLWKERGEDAVSGWSSVRSGDTAAQRPSFAYLVDSALGADDHLSMTDDPPSERLPEDSDSWLEVTPDALDDLLNKAGGSSQTRASEHATVDRRIDPGEQLQDMAKKVEAFIGGEGDLQGARFTDELSDDDVDNDDNDAGEDLVEQEDQPDEWDQLSAARKQELMANLVEPLGDAEWGQKTQRNDDSDTIMIGSAAPTTQPPNDGKSEPTPRNNAAASTSKLSNSSSIRPPRFAKQEFDGVIDESESEDEDDDQLAPQGTLGRAIGELRWDDHKPQMEEVDDDEDALDQKRDQSVKWDESIDAAMRRKVAASQAREEGEDRPVVVDAGDAGMDDDEGVDVDMAAEQEEFLKFAKEALGVSEDMWNGIVESREARGAFVPTSTSQRSANGPFKGASKPSVEAKAEPLVTAPVVPSAPTVGAGGVNMGLDSFDKVMSAMEAELSKTKPPPPNLGSFKSANGTLKRPDPSQPLPALPTEADLEDLSEDDLLAMDRELKAALRSAGVEDDEEDEDDAGTAEKGSEEDQRQYRMMRDFLESYRSQGGQSGVVGNLFGRLGQSGK